MQTSPISVTRESKDAEIDQSVPKLVLLGVVGIGLSILLTKWFLGFLSALTLASFLMWFGAVAAFLVIVGLEVLLVKSAGRLFLIMVLEGLAPLVFFLPELYPHPLMALLVGDAIFFLLLAIGARRAWDVLQKSLVVQFSLATRSVFSKAVTGMLVFLAVATYVSYSVMGQFSASAARTVFDGTLASAEPIVKLWFPNVSFGQAPDAFFGSVARTQLEEIPLSALGQTASDQTVSFKSLPAALQQNLLDQATQKLEAAFESRYGAIQGATMGDVIFGVVAKEANAVATGIGDTLWVLVAVAAFFVLRGFFTLVLWLVSLITFLAYKFLVITGFAYTAIETRNREFVVLS